MFCLVNFLAGLSLIQGSAFLLMNKYCHLAMEEGVSMMGQKTVRDNRFHLRVFRGDQELRSGESNYYYSEELTVRMHGPTQLSHIVMEARYPGAVFLDTASKCTDSMTSRTNLNGSVLLLPDNTGTTGVDLGAGAVMEIAAVWATSYSGGVKVSDVFTLLPLLPPSRHDDTAASETKKEKLLPQKDLFSNLNDTKTEL